ncbi:hypothetical protein KY346_00080 [Candidatus Woesearchaeota archaeon]|nr:hypothetical protein [Candidatus Woesearchaeota archaeon]
MLGEIYIASALAIFLAIFGWSEKIFGLSSKHIQSILAFCEKAKMSYKNYLELMRLISSDKTAHPGKFQKKLISLLKGSAIKGKDKSIMKKLKENSVNLGKLEKQNRNKKIYFIVLFLFLFIAGSALVLLENFGLYQLESFIISQAVLFIIILFGVSIYTDITNAESKIQANLIILTTEIGDNQSGR